MISSHVPKAQPKFYLLLFTSWDVIQSSTTILNCYMYDQLPSHETFFSKFIWCFKRFYQPVLINCPSHSIIETVPKSVIVNVNGIHIFTIGIQMKNNISVIITYV